jgi:rsbT co-antagonist protein RsbR
VLLGEEKSGLTSGMRDLLSSISSDFVERGLTPTQTASFLLSLKRHLHTYLHDDDAQLAMHDLIDAMALFTMEAFIGRREQIIRRQTQELLEVSVPVVPLWEGVLSLPIIGSLDSGRAQAITEKLLLELARTGSRHALLDISGVPTVDTQTAQHLAKTVAAARLMGAECVITGIRPAIAQVMVTLGINFATTETRFSLAEGLRYCFARQGLSVKRQEH